MLFRLGEIAAYVECAGALARRAAGAAEGTLNPKTDTRFDADGLAAISRVFAREAGYKAAEEGLRWVVASGTYAPEDATTLSKLVGSGAVRQEQRGMLEDMQAVADALYARYTV